MTRSRFTIGRALATVALYASTSVLCPLAAQGQWRESTVGSEADLYIRALQTRGVFGGEPVSIRPYSPPVLDRWARKRWTDSARATSHPWGSRFRTDSAHVWLLPAMVQASHNSAFAWGMNDGAAWQGRGVTTIATLGFGARWRWLSLRVEPMWFSTQNRAFALLGDTARGENPFVDQQRPGIIDLPQRFGRARYARTDPGQSELRADVGLFTAGLSTMNEFWGPGVRQSLLMGSNSAGFPHLFLGSSHALRTPLGRLSGRVIYGKLSQSDQSPASPNRSRFGSAITASWQPPGGSGFEFGASRFYHRSWPDGGLKLNDLRAPLGSLFGDAQFSSGSTADNQLATLFMRWRAEDDGFELFGEFGRNDRSADARDLTVEPEHNSAWLLGFVKTFQSRNDGLWMVRSEFVNGRITELQSIGRGQATFYEHAPITQGHTERGQLLGSYLLERAGGLELSVDRWSPRGRRGLSLMYRAMPADQTAGVQRATARAQWYAEASAVRFFGAQELFAKGGLVFDLNRTPGRDVSNHYLSLGARVRIP